VRVSTKHKFVFVSTPKAASQSLYRVLAEWYGPIIGIGMHRSFVPPIFEDYFTWCVVRNPYSRTISQWWHGVGSGSKRPNGKPHLTALPDATSFPEYVRWLTNPDRPQETSQVGRNHTSNQGVRMARFRQDRVIYYENLEPEFRALPFAEEGKPPWFPLVNTNLWHASLGGRQPPDRSTLFTQELADLVYNWEQGIFEKYDYPRSSWEHL